ncbi:hypothetical protein HWV62_12242 [Athelia sp. TMB]|nr:hypothetical protein HWV62_12242 [Athelia sp. TMB]
MFQQPLKLKTSVHLQPYDRRLLKQRVLRAFPGIGEVELVPTELMLAKFRTHLNERGIAWLSEWKVVYLGPNGDPLWFTVGQDSEEIIPTVYTLWKKPDLLPTLTTFSEEIPALTVAHRKQVIEIPATPPLQPDQLVAIAQDYSARGAPKAGPPLVVGRMAVSGEELRVLVQGQGKYKKKHAVAVVHTCRDSLWEIGTDASVPEPRDISNAEAESEGEDIASLHGEATAEATPEEVTSILRTALLQSISTSFLTLPPGTFPIPAVVFYTTHILPFRPAHVSFITPIDIKCSSHKSLTTFLKAAEKEGLLQLKERRMHKHMELLVVDVDPKHHDVAAHHVRDKLTQRILYKFQTWHKISIKGRESVAREGVIKPISIVVKARRNNKVSTLVSGFEPYMIGPDVLANELKTLCASSASVLPAQTDSRTTRTPVLVQGKQIEAVTELLVSMGVPKRWIEAVDLS